VKNSGGGTLATTVVTPDPAAPWLDVQQTDAGRITFALVSDYITRGTQQATVTVTVDGALGSPVTVPVTLYGDDTFPSPDGGASEAGEVEAAAPQEVGPDSDAGAADAGAEADAFPYPEGDAPQSRGEDAAAPQEVGLDSGVGNPNAGTRAISTSGGCGCALLGVPRAAASLWMLGLALAAIRRRRRRY
jgi:hypothetical protein